MPTPITCNEDLRQLAMRRVPRAIFDYVDRGSYDELTIRANRTALDRICLRQRVMVDVQRRVDSMLEFRLREALTPILARHTEALIRDMRDELSLTMRDVVTRSVAQELAKLRPR